MDKRMRMPGSLLVRLFTNITIGKILVFLWWGATLAVSLGLLLMAWPYAVSAIHLELGGRALEIALAPVFPDRLAPERIVDRTVFRAGVVHLQQALRWDSRNIQARRLLARAYLSQGESDAAAQILQGAVAARPANSLLYLELGDVYHLLGQTKVAIKLYEAGRFGSRGVLAAANYLELAESERGKGNHEAAMTLWRQALAADPGNLYALYRLAEAHNELGDLTVAATYERQLRFFDLQSAALRDSRMADYQARAMIALVDGDLWKRDTMLNVVSYQVWQFSQHPYGEMVEKILGELLSRWPEDPDLLFYLAELYHRWNDLERAEAAYQRVLEVSPSYEQAYLRLGMVAEAKFESLNDPSPEQWMQAWTWYEQYHQMAPGDLLGLQRLTELSERLGRSEAAILREKLDREMNARQSAATLLGVQIEDVELEPNLIKDGGFEESRLDERGQWVWSAMFTREPFNEATFAGGSDGLASFEGQQSARVDGFWMQQEAAKSPARAGFWQRDEIVVEPNTPYLLSFRYRTKRVPDGGAAIYPGNPVGFGSGDCYLPATNGEWHRFATVIRSGATEKPTAQPLVRSFAEGSIQFDSLELQAIRLPEDVNSLRHQPQLLALPSAGYTRSGINLAIYRRNAMLSIDDKQLIGYVGAEGDIHFVIRDWRNSALEERSISNPMSERMLGDGHQGINMGYSEDGIVHVVFGAHVTSPFYYKLSWPDLRLVGDDVSELSLASNLISYPQFYNLDGELILLYRGDDSKTYNINRYDAESGEWSAWLAPLLTTPPEVDRVYLNDLGIQGRTIVVAYTWRYYPPGDDPNEYRVLNEGWRVILSDDAGVTWRSANNQELSLPISALTPPMAFSIPVGSNLSNQGGAWLDSDQVYRAAYFADDEDGIPQIYVSEFNLRTGQASISQVTHNATDFELTGKGTLSLPLSRPVLLGIEDRVVAIYREGEAIWAAWRTTSRDMGDWNKTELYRGFIENWEPIVDYGLLTKDTLSLYVQGAKQGLGDTNSAEDIHSPTALLDLSPEAISALMPVSNQGAVGDQ